MDQVEYYISTLIIFLYFVTIKTITHMDTE